jgi:O-acetyl-ADP-ribose deacetylase (regulator of RNase III)
VHAIEAARGFESVAFSAISTGVYGFPPLEAAGIAVSTTDRTLRDAPGALERIAFCCFSERSAALHRADLTAIAR